MAGQGPAAADTYDGDFFAWTQAQAASLRRCAADRVNLDLDFENLAEEVEGLGKSDRRALLSHAARTVEHLLKLMHSPAREPRAGWEESVARHRRDARLILADSPSLHRAFADAFVEVYRDARRAAVHGPARDGIAPEALPADPPFTPEQVLDPDWWPDRT
jgi:hypothetical protein